MDSSEDFFLREHYFLGTNFFLLKSVLVCPFGITLCLLCSQDTTTVSAYLHT